MGAQFAQQQSWPGMAQARYGNQGQEKGAHKTAVYLPVQPLLQRPDDCPSGFGQLLHYVLVEFHPQTRTLWHVQVSVVHLQRFL